MYHDQSKLNCCLPCVAVFNMDAAENLKSLDSLLTPLTPLKKALNDQYVEIGLYFSQIWSNLANLKGIWVLLGTQGTPLGHPK